MPPRKITLLLCSLLPLSTAAAKIINPLEVVKDESLTAAAKSLRTVKDQEEAATLFKTFSAAAEKGSTEGDFAVGWSYQVGFGIEASAEKAREAYQKSITAGSSAAKNNLALLELAAGAPPLAAVATIEELATSGFAAAQCTMGQLYLDGIPSAGISRDPEKARVWFERAADATTPDPDAAWALSQLFATGSDTVPADPAKAVAYAEKAVSGEQIEALTAYGARLVAGGNVKQDIERGLALLEKAAKLGSSAAIYQTGALYENGEGVKKDEKKALDYYQKAAAAGDSSSFNKIGYFYEKGMGVKASEKTAAEWYQKGADKGVGLCEYNLAVFHDEGKAGFKKNPDEAFRLHYQAALHAFVPSQVALGVRYRDGKGVARDPQAALAWFERAMQNGDVTAQVNCASLLESGATGVQNLENAARLYQDAATKGHPAAMTALAGMLESGRGMQPEYRRAFALYQIAAGGGFAAAKERFAALKARMNPAQLADAEAWAKANGGTPPAAAPAPKK